MYTHIADKTGRTFYIIKISSRTTGQGAERGGQSPVKDIHKVRQSGQHRLQAHCVSSPRFSE